jgi:hypothetical protein
MPHERKQVLDLLAQGKITPEEAERLLDKLEAAPTAEKSARSEATPSSNKPKFICIHVDGNKGDKVDLRFPLALVRTGIKLSALVPKEAADAMAKNGVDLSQLSKLSEDELTDALRTMAVDVASHKGDQVKIYCE